MILFKKYCFINFYIKNYILGAPWGPWGRAPPAAVPHRRRTVAARPQGSHGAPWGPKNIIFYIKINKNLYFLYNII